MLPRLQREGGPGRRQVREIAGEAKNCTRVEMRGDGLREEGAFGPNHKGQRGDLKKKARTSQKIPPETRELP